MKYLRSFNTKSDYKKEKKNHTLILPNVSYIKDDGSTYITPVFTTKFNAEAGDIVVYSKSVYDEWSTATDEDTKNAIFQKLLASVKYIKPEYYTSDVAEIYVPDSIVAVPYSHTDDNTLRVMSLKHMNPSSPNEGTTGANGIAWGAYVDIPNIKNHTGGVVLSSPLMGDASGLTSANPTYLPSDAFNKLEVLGSDMDYYWNSTTGNHAPCPYKSDNSLNPQFRGIAADGTTLSNNCLGDMDGKSNTKSIINALDLAYINKTLQGDTITNAQTMVVGENVSYITETQRVDPGSNYINVDGENATAPSEADGLNANGETPTDDNPADGKVAVNVRVERKTNVSTNIFPAAMCCQRYSSVLKPNVIKITTNESDNTSTIDSYGDWYLPSAGELAYIIVSRGKIAFALQQIYKINPASVALYSTDWLWSSSEYNGNNAWSLSPSDGNVNGGGYYGGKYGSGRVRAFAAF